MYFFILLQLRTEIISVRINKKSCYKPTFADVNKNTIYYLNMTVA